MVLADSEAGMDALSGTETEAQTGSCTGGGSVQAKVHGHKAH